MLSLLMITTVFALPFNASAIEPSGNINENISYTFDSESGLLTVTGTGQLPNDYTFNGSKDIKKIVIGEGITDIASDTFNYCSNVTELVLPTTLVRIRDYAFGHLAITQISLPEGFTTADGSAFGYCENVTSISLPSTLESMYGSSFDTTNVSSITIDEHNTNYKTIDGNVYTADEKKLVVYCGAKTATEFTVPEGVEDIDRYAFSTAPNIKKVTLADGMTSVPNTAFRACSSLEEIVLPETVTKICSGAFTYCSKLKKINLTEGVTEIESSAFEGCNSLTELTIPKSVTLIDSRAFMVSSYSSLNLTILNPYCVYVANAAYEIGEKVKIIAAEKCDGTCSAKTVAETYGRAYETLSVEEHDYVLDSDVPPTCTEAGTMHYTCSKCGAEKTENPAPLGHDFGDNEKVCKICGAENPDYKEPAPVAPAPKAPAKTKLTKLVAGSRRMTVKWAKKKGVSGYIIQYSLKENMKGAKYKKVKGASKSKAVIKKLKKGKRYYVRIRTYKGTAKSKWSAKKSIKVK